MPLFLPQPDSGPVYYFRQYFGAVCILSVVLLLLFCYDSDVMTDNQLTFLVVALAVVGLIFHELRPFKVQAMLSLQAKSCVQRWENIVAEVNRREGTDPAHQD